MIIRDIAIISGLAIQALTVWALFVIRFNDIKHQGEDIKEMKEILKEIKGEQINQGEIIAIHGEAIETLKEKVCK